MVEIEWYIPAKHGRVLSCNEVDEELQQSEAYNASFNVVWGELRVAMHCVELTTKSWNRVLLEVQVAMECKLGEGTDN